MGPRLLYSLTLLLVIPNSLPRHVDDPKDDQFRQCCLTKPLAKAYYAHCTYNRPLDPMLGTLRMFLLESSEGLREYLECASGHRDWTACCERKGIEGSLCLFFCNGSNLNETLHPNMPAELVCAETEMDKVDGIRECFHENAYEV
jgi:DB module